MGEDNVVALVDNTGTVQDRYSYGLWGNLVSSSETVQQTFLYTGYWYDRELGWYWLSVRDYNPVLERFIQPDPSFQEEIRSYIYASDDPIDATDPSGLSDCKGDHDVLSWLGDQLCKAGNVAESAASAAGTGVHAATGAVGSAANHLGSAVNHFLGCPCQPAQHNGHPVVLAIPSGHGGKSVTYYLLLYGQLTPISPGKAKFYAQNIGVPVGIAVGIIPSSGEPSGPLTGMSRKKRSLCFVQLDCASLSP